MPTIRCAMTIHAQAGLPRVTRVYCERSSANHGSVWVYTGLSLQRVMSILAILFT